MGTDANDTGDMPPKRYIRTFAGDMKTLQGGNEPELKPLTTAEAEPTPTAPGPSIGQAHLMPPPEPIIPTQPIREEKQVPLAPPKPPEPPASPIETYAGDFSDHVKETGATPTTVLAAEQDARVPSAPQPTPVPSSSRSSIWYIIGGAILIVIASVAAFLAYARYASSVPQTIILAPNLSAPIAVDERAQVSGTGEALMGAIARSVGTPIKAGTVRLLAATTTTTSIFSSLDLSAPDILTRNVNAAGSMAGIVVADGVPSPFFILSVASYGDTFSGMLSWEPDMLNDLSPLFPAYATTVASTSATSSTPTMTAGFRDEVIGNHDARVYRDAQGRSVILYGYWNQGTLILARDPAAFSILLERLAASGNSDNSGS